MNKISILSNLESISHIDEWIKSKLNSGEYVEISVEGKVKKGMNSCSYNIQCFTHKALNKICKKPILEVNKLKD